jgi:putative heme transporter
MSDVEEPAGTDAAPRRRFGLRRVVVVLVGVAVIVATFAFLLPQVADYREVWDLVVDLSWAWVLALVVATALNLVTFAPPWMVALPGLDFRHAFVLTQASTALTIVVPGGAAVGIAGSYGMLRSWRFPSGQVARAVTLTGLWNQFANLLFPIVALFLLSVTGGRTALLTTAAFVGVAALGVAVSLLVLVLATDTLARGVGDVIAGVVDTALGWVRRGPVTWGGDSFVSFRREAVDLLRRRWHALTLATLAGHLTVFLVLVVSLRAFGVESAQVSLAEAFAAWSLIRILGAIPLTPGGIGVIELGLTGALIAFGGPNAAVVAAVLVYRFLTVVPTLVLGLLAALTWRRHRPPESEPVAG